MCCFWTSAWCAIQCVCLCTAPLTHPSLFLLTAVTVKRNHWMGMLQLGTASAETVWSTMPMVEENLTRMVHLSENILDPSMEALLASPVDLAQSLQKPKLQLKWSTSYPCKILFKFSFPGNEYNWNGIIWRNKNDSNVLQFLLQAEVLPSSWKGKNTPTLHTIP